MERFFGFDLGDAESAVCVLEEGKAPRILTVCSEKSFITAYARLRNQELLIGENACYHSDAVIRRLRFKSRFLSDKGSGVDVQVFAGGVLAELYQTGELSAGEETVFYIGCPAGWDVHAREKYRVIFEKAGFPPVKIISESRAALVSACHSKHLQVGYDIASHPVLVVDIGSSTTDFAYICEGREAQLQTAGEVCLGGGIMDELLLEESIKTSPDPAHIQEVFAKSEPWRSYCEFAARKLKEKYFLDEEYWKKCDCIQTITLLFDEPTPLVLSMSEKTVERILYEECSQLGGKSFFEVFVGSLKEAREGISGPMPEILFLTGGVSKLPQISDWCRKVFPEAVVITSAHPEFSVAEGLAWCGKTDSQIKAFSRDVEALKDSDTVERIVGKHIAKLYRSAVDVLARPIIENAVLPAIDRWRDGEISRLADINEVMEKEITAYLHTQEARELLVKPVSRWLRPVAQELEKTTVPICVKHNVPYRALSLNSYLSLAEVDIRVDAKDVFALEEITWMIDTIITIVVGLLCGGSGIALIAQGLPGVVAGTVISLMVLFLGKDKMQGMLMQANIPIPMRKLMGRGAMEARMDKITIQVKENLYKSLQKEMDGDITRRLVGEISSQIDECLVKMAKVVEIPL